VSSIDDDCDRCIVEDCGAIICFAGAENDNWFKEGGREEEFDAKMSTAVAVADEVEDEGYEDTVPNCCCTCLCCDGIIGGNEDIELEILAEAEAGVGANRSSRPDKEDDDASVFEAACDDLKSGLTPEEGLMLDDEPAAFEMSADDDTELNKSSKLSSKLATGPFDDEF
jgi:hypothetical protein